MLIVCRYIFQLKLIEIIVFEVLDAFKSDLNILRCSSSALSYKICNNFSFVYLSNAFNRESPKYLLTYHNQDLALVHTAGVRNK
jgi:hypothetical protein